MTLIRTEWLKMRKYNAFWWIMGLTLLSYPGINYILYIGYNEMTSQPDQVGQYLKMGLGNPFAFPEVWHSVAYFSSWFVFIPAVVIIMFITNEYTFRTHRQNIIDGWSRRQFITSKLIDVLIVSLIITLLYFFVALISGTLNKPTKPGMWTQSYYTGLFFLQTFSQLSLAFFTGFLVRKAFLALGIFLFYFLILENFIVGFLNWKKVPIASYFPLEVSDKLIPRPGFTSIMDPVAYQKSLDDIPLHVGLTIVLLIITWAVCYRLHNKRDLK